MSERPLRQGKAHTEFIEVVNARVHNLKSISVRIPKSALTVVTGPSGSGKSSLVFDTLWVEAQRRFTGSLPAYVRQILGVWEKPDVDRITGLAPAVALDARPAGASPRSTVGTVSEIYDYLRVLAAKAGAPTCPECGTKLARTPREAIIEALLGRSPGSRLVITAPLGVVEPKHLSIVWDSLRREGFLRVYVGGRLATLEENPPQAAEPRHVSVVVDRLVVKPEARQRIAEAVETALSKAGGRVGVIVGEGREENFSERFHCDKCGFTAPELSESLFSFNNPLGACKKCNGLGVVSPKALDRVCPACGGARLNPLGCGVRLGGKRLSEILLLPLEELRRFLCDLELEGALGEALRPIREEMKRRVDLLLDLGLGYLSINRSVPTLSAGEYQRLRLANQISGGLTGLLYLLDEPTVGLHPSETEKLLGILGDLCRQGNTVIAVEHDLQVIEAADYVIDLGPGGGPGGGSVVASGPPEQVARSKESVTGRFLKEGQRLSAESFGAGEKDWIVVRGARAHNLKNIEVSIPLCALTCVTGPSGSGKSSLVLDVLYRGLAGKLRGKPAPKELFSEIKVDGPLQRVTCVDQSPVGRSARSNPATYTGLFKLVRSFYALLPLARMRGYGPQRFSFNVKGGRCEICKGEGVRRVSMQFLPDITVTCDVCNGSRYNAETLEVRYRGLSIADVLDLTVSEAAEVFESLPRVAEQLRFLEEIGLGYLTLGQRADTLSGGEAQRLKLSRELAALSRNTLYVLDEPTTGLHPADVSLLLKALRRLIEAGNTVVVVEHNMFFAAQADYLIDLGPGAGGDGGWVVAAGTPREVANSKKSPTAPYLRGVLA